MSKANPSTDVKSVWIALVVVGVFILFSNGLAKELHPVGCLPEDPSQRPWMHKSPVKAKPVKQLSVDLTPFMPPVGDQQYQGSCVAWAVGYYHKTFQEWYERRWDVDTTDHQFSPAFIYNQINGGVDDGAYFTDATKCLIDHGCANLVDSPYNDADSTSWPTEAAYSNAIPYRSDSAYFLWVGDSSGIEVLKALISDSNVVVLGIDVWSTNFDRIVNYDTMYCVADTGGGYIRGGHAVTIVGYNDTLVTHDGTGAFRLVNSWGTDWGHFGYFWMSYEAVQHPRLSHQWAYYTTDRIAYSPVVETRWKITHPTRQRVAIQMGIGDTLTPDWTKSFFDWYMPVQADYPFAGHNIVFDISDGESWFDPAGTNIFMQCEDTALDSDTGTVEHLYAHHFGWGASNSSTETPKNIPDGGPKIYVNLTISETDIPDIVVEPDTLELYCEAAMIDAATMWVKNVGNGALNVTNITKTQSWIISINPTSFVTTAGDSQSVVVKVMAAGLSDGTYYDSLQIASHDPDENLYFETVKFVVSLVNVEEEPYAKFIPKATSLLQNFPNPFHASTVIRYSLSEPSHAVLKIYDASGRLVRKLSITDNRSPITEVVWDGRDKFGKKVPSGIYFYRLQTEKANLTKKLILLK